MEAPRKHLSSTACTEPPKSTLLALEPPSRLYFLHLVSIRLHCLCGVLWILLSHLCNTAPSMCSVACMKPTWRCLHRCLHGGYITFTEVSRRLHRGSMKAPLPPWRLCEPPFLRCGAFMQATEAPRRKCSLHGDPAEAPFLERSPHGLRGETP